MKARLAILVFAIGCGGGGSGTTKPDGGGHPDGGADDDTGSGSGNLVLKKASKVVVGNGTTFVLTTDGEVRGFGWGDYLGFGGGANQLVPKTVPGLESGIVDIGSYYQTTCAVRSDGTVMCWGDNSLGTVGNGTITDALMPTAVTGLTDVKSISVGLDTACALTSTGVVKCWGSNEARTLDAMTPDPDNTNSWVPSLVPITATGLGGPAKLVRVGFRHGCAIMMDNTLKCWGENTFGQLGNGLDDGQSQPTTFGMTVPSVAGLTGVVDVAPSDHHTTAVLATGAVKAWGDQENGNLGNGSDDTGTEIYSPVGVTGLSTGATTAGATCAVVTGSVWCWRDNRGGGNGEAVYSTTPTQVPGITDAVQVSTGEHTCVVLASGKMKCFGDNTNGPLGIGIDGSQDGDVDVQSPQDVLSFQ